MDRSAMAHSDLNRLVRAVRFEHGVAIGFQYMACQFPKRILVLHKQDCFRAAPRLSQSGGWFFHMERLSGARQVNLECRALAWFAVDPDMAAALPDNSIDCRKTEARAFSEFLGRKEGVEDAALSLRVHPDSSIGNCQQDVCARLLGLVPACVVLIQVNISRFNHQLPTLRHPIPGADRNI